MIKYTLPIIFILLISCNPNDDINNDDYYKYDPNSAGAELILSRDITESFEVKWMSKYGEVTFYTKNDVIDNVHDIAVHGDYVYIKTSSFIHIYDKNTLEYIKTVEMDFKEKSIYVNRIVINARQYGGFIVTDDFAIMLYNSTLDLLDQNSSSFFNFYRPYILYIDLETGEFEIADAAEELQISLDSKVLTFMGFDKENGLYWFRKSDNNESMFYFFRFDAETQSFIFQETKKGFVLDWSNYKFQVAIHGSMLWRGCYIHDIREVGLEKCDIDNLQKRLQVIIINHLGLRKDNSNLPARFAFNGEHIYLTVMDKTNVKLLKIKPNSE
ncbi:hypothetical protein [Treponema sp. R80B11-R83G3]